MTVPPRGGGGIAPQICTIVSPCKSASAPLAPCKNSLAFGSASGREADSQPVSQLVRPVVSQKHIVWVFLVVDLASSSGEDSSCCGTSRAAVEW